MLLTQVPAEFLDFKSMTLENKKGQTILSMAVANEFLENLPFYCQASLWDKSQRETWLAYLKEHELPLPKCLQRDYTSLQQGSLAKLMRLPKLLQDL